MTRPNRLRKQKKDEEGVILDELDLAWEVVEALEQDDKDKFVSLINNLKSKDKVPSWECNEMYLFDSVNCVASVLAGETAGFIDITEADNPLHEAAINNAPRVTALLLNDDRFIASARSDFSDFKNVLPLEVALATLRSNAIYIYASRNSAIDLLTELCRPVMRHALETVRLLAMKTKQLKREFLNYLNEGKMVEVGALLLVSSDELLSEAADGFGFKTIMDIYNYVLINKEKRTKNAEMLLLLEIFDRIGDKLAAYIRLDLQGMARVRLEIASLIEDAGFHVKTEDLYGPDLCTGMFASDFYTTVFVGGRVNDSKNRVTTALQQGVPNWIGRKLDERTKGSRDFDLRPFSTMTSIANAKPSFPIHRRSPALLVASLKGGVTIL